MAATVEGVFRIIDRATPRMKAMEKQAIKTDAAIEALGARLDTLGSSKKLKNLDNLNRRVHTMSQETTLLDKSTSKLDQTMKKHNTTLSKSDSMWKRFTGTAKMFGKDVMKLLAPAKFLAIGTAVGVAGQAIGALSGGVLGLSSAVGSLGGALAPALAGITGIGLAAITGKLAMKNLSQAMAGNAQALRSLTPEGHKFVVTLREFRPIMREFRRSSQGGLFAGLRSAMGGVRQAAPTINRALAGMSNQLGSLARQAGKRFTTRGFLADFANIAGQGTDVVGAGGRSMMNIVSALRHVAVAARPLTQWISKMVEGWSKYADRSAKAGRESGRLAAFFERTRKTMTTMGHILRNIGKGFAELFKASRPLGDLLYGDAERGTKAWANMLGTQKEQTSLMTRMLSMEPAIKSLFHLVAELGKAIFKMGSDTKLADTVDKLTTAVPTLGKVLSGLANTFGPAFGSAIGSLAKLLQDITGAGGGPMVGILKAVSGIANFLDRIVRASPPIKSLFTFVFSSLLLSRYAIKLGLLEKGWYKVAFAARSAAREEMLASSVPGGSPVGMLGGRGRGIKGFFGKIKGFGRGGGAAVEGEQLAMDVGSAGGKVGMLGRAGGLLAGAGKLGMMAKFGGAALGKLFLPLTIMQGLFGALTAGRSGGVGHQAAQTVFGGANAITGGIAGHFYHGLDTPEARAARAVSGNQKGLERDMAAAGKVNSGMALLTAQLQILKTAANQVQDKQTSASKDYIAQLKAQTEAIQANIVQIKSQQTAQGNQNAGTYLQSLDKAAAADIKQKGLVPGWKAADTTAMGDVAKVKGMGNKAQAQRGSIIAHILGNAWKGAQAHPELMPEYKRVAAWATQTFAAHGHPFQVSGGQVYTGSRGERRSLATALALPDQRRQAAKSQGLTRMQQALVASLTAGGMSPSSAMQTVQMFEGSYDTMTKSGLVVGKKPFAGGGRLGGAGLFDTVPVPGGMAAPGELVVNRHTERRVNSMLGTTTLGSMVGGENKRHSDGFAKGGRTHWDGNTALTGRIGDIVGLMERKFPELVVTSTVRADTHGVHGSSYHDLGMAADLAGGGSAYMDKAGVWAASHLMPQLLEGIHNPTLSVKNGAPILSPEAFWGIDPSNGQSIWSEHFSHLHFAAKNSGAAAALAPKKGGGAKSGKGSAAATVPLTGALASIIQDTDDETDRLGGLGGLGLDLTPVGTAPAGKGKGKGNKAKPAGKFNRTFPSFISGASGNHEQLTPGQVNRIAASVGLPGTIFEKIAHGESSYFPGIQQKDPGDGNVGYGLWQMTPHAWGPSSSATKQMEALGGIPAMFNPVKNAKMAKFLYDHASSQTPNTQGFPWYGTQYLAKGGRLPKFGGWHGMGMDGVFNTPTMIGVGDKGRERVTVTPAGKSGGGNGKVEINATFHINGGEPGHVRQEVEAALRSFAQHLQNAEAPD